jgi:hypothetical protein
VDAILRARASTNGKPASTRSCVVTLRSTLIDVLSARRAGRP